MVRAKALFLIGLLFFSTIFLLSEGSEGEFIDPMYYQDERLCNSNVTFLGESANDQAGFSVSICGDVNKDGFDDILIGAPTNDENGNDSGQVYLIFGKESGYVMDMNISNSSASFHGEQAGNMLGGRVAGAGDVNGDGYADFLITALNLDEYPNYTGKVYLILGKEIGWEIDMNISNCSASFYGEFPEDDFGYSISCVGDIDDDGFDDFAMVALHSDFGGNQSGKAYIVYGKSSGWSRNQNASTCDASFYGFDDWKRVGRSVHGGGDINGDGIDDLMVASHGRRHDGRVYIFFGNNSRWRRNLNISICDVTIDGPTNGHLGVDMDSKGDINGDGIEDLVIGSPSYPQSGGPTIQAGTVYVIHGRTSGWKKLYRTGRAEYDLSLIGENSYGHIGSQISYLGDINFDGYDDFIAAGVRSGALNGGETYLVLGRERFKFRNLSFGKMNASFMGTTQEYSGSSISGNGDVNGDTIPDILIGAPRNGSKGRHTGAVYLIFPYMTYAPVDVAQLKVFSDPGYTREINWTPINTTVYLQVVGKDSNPLSRDRAMVEVDGGYTYDHVLWLDEVGVNTGVFRSELTVSWDETFGKNVQTRIGDTLEIESREGRGLSTELFIGIPVNIHPKPGDMTIYEDELLSMEFRSDGMNPVIGWDVTFDINDWLTWKGDHNRLAGIPLNDDIGLFEIEITARDLYGFTETIGFSITVLNTPPKILTESRNTTLEDEAYIVDYDSSDDPSGITRWTHATNADWLDLDRYSGLLSGTPSNDDVGIYDVNITVNDGNGGKRWQEFALQVIDVNDAPKIIGLDQKIVVEEELYLVDYDAVDIDDPEEFIWNLSTDAEWLTLNGTSGILSGTPAQEDVGSYIVNISVEDVRGGLDSREFNLIVAEVNDAPLWLDVPGDRSLMVGDDYHFDVNASDPDPDDKLTFGIGSSPPSNISIDSERGEIWWTAGLEPFITDPYVLMVELSVSDGKTTIYHSFELEVIPLHTPLIKLISPGNDEKISYRNVTLDWELFFFPQDQGNIQYVVYYSRDEVILEDLPSSENILITNGSTTYSLTDVSPGDIIHWTIIPRTERTTGTCIDGVQRFRVNRAPQIQPVENISIVAGSELRLSLMGSDSDMDDKDNLEFTKFSAPQELYIDRTTGFIIWTTTLNDVGNHSVIIDLTDGTDTTHLVIEISVIIPSESIEPEKSRSLLPILLLLIISTMVILSVLGFFIYKRKISNGIILDDREQ